MQSLPNNCSDDPYDKNYSTFTTKNIQEPDYFILFRLKTKTEDSSQLPGSEDHFRFFTRFLPQNDLSTSTSFDNAPTVPQGFPVQNPSVTQTTNKIAL